MYKEKEGKDFLQSQEWKKFQESVGRKTFSVSAGGCNVNIIEHKLPIIGKYFYVPRFQGTRNKEQETKIFENIVDLAEKNNVRWVRVDIDSKKDLDLISKLISKQKLKIKKAPHNMQPRQTFVIDISKSEEELLAEMKSKTRYNVRLAEKKGVSIEAISNFEFPILNQNRILNDKISKRSDNLKLSNSELFQNSKFKIQNSFYVDEFLRLLRITSGRQGIVSHSDEYYRKMFEIPCVQLYVAEYEGKVVAAAVVSFFEDMAIYLHGASDDKYKNVMAPFALHWQVIKDAKKKGCKWYDMGGVKTKMTNDKFPMTNKCQNQNDKISKKIPNTKYQILNTDWEGITRFKVGFSPETSPTEFAGSYDIVIDPMRYYLYEIIRKAKSFVRKKRSIFNFGNETLDKRKSIV